MKDWQDMFLKRAQEGLDKLEKFVTEEDKKKQVEEKINTFTSNLSKKAEEIKRSVEELKSTDSDQTSEDTDNNSIGRVIDNLGKKFNISDEQREEIKEVIDDLFDDVGDINLFSEEKDEEQSQFDEDIDTILDECLEESDFDIEEIKERIKGTTDNIKKLVMFAKAKMALDSTKQKVSGATTFVKTKYTDTKELIDAYNNLTREDQQKINNEIKLYIHSLASEYRENIKEAKNLFNELNQDTNQRYSLLRESIIDNIHETSESYNRKVFNVFSQLSESIEMLEIACSKKGSYSYEELYEICDHLIQVIVKHHEALIVFENLNNNQYKKYFEKFNSDTQKLYNLIREYNVVAPIKINMIDEKDKVDINGYKIGVFDKNKVDLVKKDCVEGYDYIYGTLNNNSYTKANIYSGLKSGNIAIYVGHNRLLPINDWLAAGKTISINGRNYTANCDKFIPICNFEEMRSAMYQSSESITPYYEEGISTEEEIQKVIEYTSNTLGINNSKQYQI